MLVAKQFRNAEYSRQIKQQAQETLENGIENPIQNLLLIHPQSFLGQRNG